MVKFVTVGLELADVRIRSHASLPQLAPLSKIKRTRKATSLGIGLPPALDIALFIVLGLLGTLIPIGNENATVRRVPWVTFAIIGLNIIVFVFVYTKAPQPDQFVRSAKALESYLESNKELLTDKEVLRGLDQTSKETGVAELNSLIDRARRTENTDAKDHEATTATGLAAKRKHVVSMLGDLKSAAGYIGYYYRWGITPNGEWRWYQLFTSAFMHGGLIHLFGNLLFFFVIGFNLEDLWGRGVFLVFYLAAAAVASVPYLVDPIAVPLIGASGAVSACMGAFLVRMPRVRLEIRWVPILILVPVLLVWRPALIAIPLLLLVRRFQYPLKIPAYVYIPLFFLIQVLSMWYDGRMATHSVAHYAHFAGCAFGVVVALLFSLTGVERRLINPRIEGKVSFSAAPAVSQALDLLENGEVVLAERRLRTHVAAHPDDVEGVMALIQVYQRTRDHVNLNLMTSRLVTYYLGSGDKRQALAAYQSLVAAVGGNREYIKLAVREWFMLCEFLERSGRLVEAVAEYEWLAACHPGATTALRAYVKGGEAAVQAGDFQSASGLFHLAEQIGLPPGFESRVRQGLEVCQKHSISVPGPESGEGNQKGQPEVFSV